MVLQDTPVQPPVLADFRVVRLIGEGNHGRFYLAHPPARLGIDDEFVAVKVFAGQCSEDAYRRGTRELRAFAAVDSPYLARVYDAVLEDNFLYAMEYFPLGSLAAPARPLTRDEVLRAVEHAARAVHALHEAGMAHGDVKPGNVMLHDDGGKLSDLGPGPGVQRRRRADRDGAGDLGGVPRSVAAARRPAVAGAPTSGRWAPPCTARCPARACTASCPNASRCWRSAGCRVAAVGRPVADRRRGRARAGLPGAAGRPARHRAEVADRIAALRA